MEDTLGAQLAHNKAHALDHGVSEAGLVYEIALQPGFGQAATEVSSTRLEVADLPLKDGSETFQACASLIRGLLDPELKEQLIDPLEALLAKRLRPVLVFAISPLVDLGQHGRKVVSNDVGAID